MTCYIQLYDEGIGGKREGGRERERNRERERERERKRERERETKKGWFLLIPALLH